MTSSLSAQIASVDIPRLTDIEFEDTDIKKSSLDQVNIKNVYFLGEQSEQYSVLRLKAINTDHNYTLESKKRIILADIIPGKYLVQFIDHNYDVQDRKIFIINP